MVLLHRCWLELCCQVMQVEQDHDTKLQVLAHKLMGSSATYVLCLHRCTAGRTGQAGPCLAVAKHVLCGIVHTSRLPSVLLPQ